MLVLPVDEDTWIFHACLYVGMAIMVLDVVLPRLFHRRVRLVVPPMAQVLPPLPRPTKMMTRAQFRRKKRELQKMIRALERGDDGDAGNEEAYSAVETASEREDGQNQRNEERYSQKLGKRAAKTMIKKTSRVVMQGDTDDRFDEEQKETDEYVAPHATRSASKRVSFDMADDVSQREPQQQSTRRQATPSRSHDTTTPMAADEGMATTASATKTTKQATASSPLEPANTSQRGTGTAPHSRRPDPFSLVDDAFPWQLPNYATMATTATTTAMTAAVATATTFATLPSQPAAPLTVRRPFGPFNGASSTSTLSASTTLELKHKPLWKRSTRESNGGASASRSPLVPSSSHHPPQNVAISATTTASLAHEASHQPVPHTSVEPPLRPSFSSVPFQKWRVPSPKPPLPPRQAGAATATTSAMETTPVAPPVKLRTPKIIRRITFDEDMMGLLATPSDVSPFVTDTTRKRRRDQDVLEALDAVGLPWHKRRLHSSGD